MTIERCKNVTRRLLTVAWFVVMAAPMVALVLVMEAGWGVEWLRTGSVSCALIRPLEWIYATGDRILGQPDVAAQRP